MNSNVLFNTDGEDDDDKKKPADEPGVSAGDYDLGDDIGERIGEHEEDPSL